MEAYRKDYAALPLEDPARGFASAGTGFAHGLNVLAAYRSERLDGFLAYSLLEARRRHTAFLDRGRYPVPEAPVPVPFEVPHTLQANLRITLPGSFGVGVAARAASGQPFTPVVGAVPGAAGLPPSPAPSAPSGSPRTGVWTSA